jgi:hypothetical protein
MGRHRTRITNRGKAVLAGVAVPVVAVLLLASVSLAQRTAKGDGLARPADACTSPPAMRTSHGVKLQPKALKAFRKAERLAGHSLDVVESYRSCAQQAVACDRICQNPGGCPGRCAPPGASYHQLGLAVDVSQSMLDAPEVVTALEEAGWCQSLPDSDPGHFSFGGCH